MVLDRPCRLERDLVDAIADGVLLVPDTLKRIHGIRKDRPTLTAVEIFDLVRAKIDRVERETGLESVSSVNAVTYIGR